MYCAGNDGVHVLGWQNLRPQLWRVVWPNVETTFLVETQDYTDMKTEFMKAFHIAKLSLQASKSFCFVWPLDIVVLKGMYLVFRIVNQRCIPLSLKCRIWNLWALPCTTSWAFWALWITNCGRFPFTVFLIIPIFWLLCLCKFFHVLANIPSWCPLL